MNTAWILSSAVVCGALVALGDVRAQEPPAAAPEAPLAGASTPPAEGAAERVADVRRSLTLKNGDTCRVRIEVLRLPDKRIRVLVHDESPAAARHRSRCEAQVNLGTDDILTREQPYFTPLRTDARGMGEYEAAAPPKGCSLLYSIDYDDDEEEEDSDADIILLDSMSISGKIPLTPEHRAPTETGRPGCWGQAEFPAEEIQPAAPLIPPAAADCVSDMVVEVPLPGGTLGKLQASIYRRPGGFLFITEDVTPGAHAPFYISDISYGCCKTQDGYSVTIGPSYNGNFTTLQSTRRGIGCFFLPDERITAYHPKCIAVLFDFRICDAENRELTSFSAEVDMPQGSAAAK